MGQHAYNEWLKADLGEVIGELELSDLEKHFLKSRWLGQVLWMGGKASQCQLWHYALRVTAILGGVVVPALVGLQPANGQVPALRWATFGLSLVVAASVALEGFFRFGERWRHYRRSVESLQAEGWQFFQRCGPYAPLASHAAAFPEFARRVEELLGSEVEAYVTRVVKEPAGKQEK
ncbi:MAG: DUF4231 domain-containing protein [Proteobacteria bacterium]|nr:DUF4231 domain-containing protein [Pseudomonadota bacterium]